MDQITSFSKYIIKQHLGGAIMKNNVSINRMMMIDPTKGWFKIIEIMAYDIYEVMGGHDEYTDK